MIYMTVKSCIELVNVMQVRDEDEKGMVEAVRKDTNEFI